VPGRELGSLPTAQPPCLRLSHAPPRGGALPARLVVLASGGGSTLQALLDAGQDEAYGARVVAVGSDRPQCRALQRARDAGVPAVPVALEDSPDRAGWNLDLADAVAAHEPDLVVLAGFMRILAPGFLGRFPQRVVNTHPALLPSFPGAHAVADALAYGVKVSGVTVHLVDEGVDTGPVVAQAAVPVLDGDDEAALQARIQEVERPLYVEAVGRLARRGWTVEGRTVRWQ
jgi:phosphoribosylglycinamide formyltransferase-1